MWKWEKQLTAVFERTRKKEYSPVPFTQAERDRAALVYALREATNVCDHLRSRLSQAGIDASEVETY